MKTLKLLFFFCIAIFVFSCRTKPKTVNEVCLSLVTDPETLNPVYAALTEQAGMISGQIFQSLTTIDFKSLKLIPLLAEALPTKENITEGKYKDGMKLTYVLRKEAVWDNGKPISAADVEFSLKVCKNPLLQGGAAVIRSSFSNIDSISFYSDNPKKFSVYTKEKNIRTEAEAGDFIMIPSYIFDSKNLLKDFSVSLLGDDARVEKMHLTENAKLKEFTTIFTSEKMKEDTATILGSGAYRLSQWKKGEKVVLVKKKDWWGNAIMEKTAGLEAYPDRIIYKIITDPGSSLLALKKGDIDVMSRIPPKDFTELKNDTHFTNRYQLFTPVDLNHTYIAINLRNAALHDIAVRRAMAYLTPVDTIINHIMYSLAMPTVSMESPANSAEYNASIKRIKFSTAEAVKILDDAGWKPSAKDGIRYKKINGKMLHLSFSLKLNNNPARVSISSVVKEEYKKAGIEIMPEVIDLNKLRMDMMKGEYDLAISGSVSVPLAYDPYQMWHTKSISDGGNFTTFGNEKTDGLIDSIRYEMDESKRIEKYKRFQQIVYDELPVIYIYYSKGRVAISKKFSAEASTLRPGFNVADFKAKE